MSRIKEIDVIIVGGGTAGCVVASRLSENPKRNVLLLEAGECFEPDKFPKIIADADIIGDGKKYEWGDYTTPGFVGHKILAIHGKVLGGGSAINAGAAPRALPSDFDQWPKEWSFDKVLETFKFMENTPVGDDKWHGRTGPFPIRQDKLTNTSRAFIDSCKKLGLPYVDDFNGEKHFGVGVWPVNIIDGIRMNNAMNYLTKEVRKRKNLTIRCDLLIDKVIFDGKKAIGIKTSKDEIINGKEIILCAGAYGSPGILMRSGIGLSEELTKLGIKVIADLPVGKQLFDHPFYYMEYKIKKEKRKEINDFDVFVWTKSKEALKDSQDIMLVVFMAGDLKSIVIGVACVQPKSRGTFKISSKDPKKHPIIDLGLLVEKSDRDRLIEGVKLIREIMSTHPFSEFIEKETQPGIKLNLEKDIIDNIDSFAHPCNANAMGKVVDSFGLVKGVENLRVVDSSIFPSPISCPINVTTTMLAERIAKHI